MISLQSLSPQKHCALLSTLVKRTLKLMVKKSKKLKITILSLHFLTFSKQMKSALMTIFRKNKSWEIVKKRKSRKIPKSENHCTLISFFRKFLSKKEMIKRSKFKSLTKIVKSRNQADVIGMLSLADNTLLSSIFFWRKQKNRYSTIQKILYFRFCSTFFLILKTHFFDS